MTEDMGRFTTDKEGFCIIDFVGNEVWEGKYSDETKSLCNQLNNLCNENRELKKENEQLKHNNKMLSMKMSEVSTKYRLLKEFSEDTNPNEAVKTVLHELMMITKEYR